MVYERTLLINSHINWKWEGVIHEVITSSQAMSSELLKGVTNYSNTDGARSQDPKKYLRDAQILEEALLKDPKNSRYTFFLAQSYANAEEYLLALKNYQKRASMGGLDQEVFWSLYCIPRLQRILNEPSETVIKNLWSAFQYRPLRAEPLFELINYYLANNNYPLAYILSKYACSIPTPNDMLYVDQRIYDYGLLIQLVDSSYFMGKYTETFQAITQLLDNPRLPQQERVRMKQKLSIVEEKRTVKNIFPRVSIITSVWNGDQFIKDFLVDITRQTIFNQCELILVNANSPGSEDAVIESYRAQYPNILYIKLPFDPGLYGVWNHAIKIASSPLITNVNLDDRNRVDCLEKQVEALEADPSIDLVYAAYYLTKIPNETYENNHKHGGGNPPEFSMKNMVYCLPGPRPMWRKSLHERYGFFSELFFSAGDYEMWLRAASMGAKFKKIPGILSLIFENPKGLSTDEDPKRVYQRKIELELIIAKYSYLFSAAPTEN